MTKSQALKKARKLWGENADVSGRQRNVWKSPEKQTPSCFVGVIPKDRTIYQLTIYGEDCTWEMAFDNAKKRGH